MLILASKSPRRSELLTMAGYDFKIVPAVKDEIVEEGALPEDTVVSLANQKASEVASAYKDDVVIGADTIVCLDGKIMGKPLDKEDAFRMLRSLSGREHFVYTGVCIVSDKEVVSFYEATKVTFYELSDNEIIKYISSGEPMDKAGAYGIQGKGALLVKKIEGDYYNVVGLPISKVVRALNHILSETLK